jgi:hypothetical protein
MASFQTVNPQQHHHFYYWQTLGDITQVMHPCAHFSMCPIPHTLGPRRIRIHELVRQWRFMCFFAAIMITDDSSSQVFIIMVQPFWFFMKTLIWCIWALFSSGFFNLDETIHESLSLGLQMKFNDFCCHLVTSMLHSLLETFLSSRRPPFLSVDPLLPFQVRTLMRYRDNNLWRSLISTSHPWWFLFKHPWTLIRITCLLTYLHSTSQSYNDVCFQSNRSRDFFFFLVQPVMIWRRLKMPQAAGLNQQLFSSSDRLQRMW